MGQKFIYCNYGRRRGFGLLVLMVGAGFDGREAHGDGPDASRASNLKRG